MEQTFYDRLLSEREELAEKKAKLSDFLVSGKAEQLDKHQFNLLHAQHSAMQLYHDILRMRIELLKA